MLDKGQSVRKKVHSIINEVIEKIVEQWTLSIGSREEYRILLIDVLASFINRMEDDPKMKENLVLSLKKVWFNKSYISEVNIASTLKDLAILASKTEFNDWISDVTRDICSNDTSLFPKNIIEILNGYMFECKSIDHALIVMQIILEFCPYKTGYVDSHLHSIKLYLDIDQVYNIEDKVPIYENKKFKEEKINKLQCLVCEIISEVSKTARKDMNKWQDISNKL